MEIQAAILCDSATVREGLLHVLGGGITRLWRGTVPAPLNVALAGFVAMDGNDLGALHEFHIAIRSDATNETIAEAMGGVQSQRPERLEAGEQLLVPFVAPLHNVGTMAYGRHTLTVSLDAGATTREISFWVLNPEELQIPPL
jgi:hypothetical protein